MFYYCSGKVIREGDEEVAGTRCPAMEIEPKKNFGPNIGP